MADPLNQHTEELLRWTLIYNKTKDPTEKIMALSACGECAERISHLIQQELAPWQTRQTSSLPL